MKERIVVKDEIFAKFLIENKDNHDISASPKVIMDRCKVEQVPTNWEELKELCRDIKEIKVEEDYIEIHGVLIGSNMLFCNDGAIFLNTDCCFKEKATPQQMWQIIKNLIGEE